jgi:hypothetical protein
LDLIPRVWLPIPQACCLNFLGHVNVVVGLQTYILDVHPFTPRIAMGAGYDGHVIIWDVSCFTENPQNLFDLFGEQDGMYLLIEEPGTDVTTQACWMISRVFFFCCSKRACKSNKDEDRS